jgi:hypothetical protein
LAGGDYPDDGRRVRHPFITTHRWYCSVGQQGVCSIGARGGNGTIGSTAVGDAAVGGTIGASVPGRKKRIVIRNRTGNGLRHGWCASHHYYGRKLFFLRLLRL